MSLKAIAATILTGTNNFYGNNPTKSVSKDGAVQLLKEARSRAPSAGQVAKKIGSISLTVGKKAGHVGLCILAGDAKDLPTVDRQGFKNLSDEQKQQYKNINKKVNNGVFL